MKNLHFHVISDSLKSVFRRIVKPDVVDFPSDDVGSVHVERFSAPKSIPLLQILIRSQIDHIHKVLRTLMWNIQAPVMWHKIEIVIVPIEDLPVNPCTSINKRLPQNVPRWLRRNCRIAATRYWEPTEVAKVPVCTVVGIVPGGVVTHMSGLLQVKGPSFFDQKLLSTHKHGEAYQILHCPYFKI